MSDTMPDIAGHDGGQPKAVKVSVRMGADVAAHLRDLAEKRGISQGELVGRALAALEDAGQHVRQVPDNGGQGAGQVPDMSGELAQALERVADLREEVADLREQLRAQVDLTAQAQRLADQEQQLRAMERPKGFRAWVHGLLG